SGSNLTTV
nr:RecName: Full=Pregnancy-associated glycoprotein 50I; AltName: Full=EbPAG-I 50 kDa [Bison bonasus]